jgi:capsular exopolysaccharide synthesis family protein
MSRFVETLKEASRLRQLQSELSPDNKTGGQGTTELNAVPSSTVNAPPKPPQPLEVLAQQAPVPFVTPSQPQSGVAGIPGIAEVNGFSGKSIKISVDRKVPIIPHTLDNSIVEQYRRLRTKIQQQHATKPIRSVLIASPGPGDGKTVTAINLALSFAMLSNTRVLVIDGDLRKGTVGKWLGLTNQAGFSNVIEGSARLEDVIIKSEELSLHFMLSGTSNRSSAELLNSPVLPETMRQLTEHFDLVVVDSPPVNLIADAQMLAGSCDGVLLVARAFRTTSKAFQKMLDDLLPFRIIGTILNGGMQARGYRGYYKY